jgi:hypothetical protein
MVGAAIYAFACIKRGKRRPDIGKMITCMAYAATLPVSAIFLVVAASGDHEALEGLTKEHDFGLYAGVAAMVVLYHGLEHLYDEIRSAWAKEVVAVPGDAPAADQARDGDGSGGKAA